MTMIQTTCQHRYRHTRRACRDAQTVAETVAASYEPHHNDIVEVGNDFFKQL